MSNSEEKTQEEIVQEMNEKFQFLKREVLTFHEQMHQKYELNDPSLIVNAFGAYICHLFHTSKLTKEKMLENMSEMWDIQEQLAELRKEHVEQKNEEEAEKE